MELGPSACENFQLPTQERDDMNTLDLIMQIRQTREARELACEAYDAALLELEVQRATLVLSHRDTLAALDNKITELSIKLRDEDPR